MGSKRKFRKAADIANHIDRLKDQIISRWRISIRQDPQQPSLLQRLDDQELEDHLPALTEKIIKLLQGEPVEGLEDNAAEHGRQRRMLGFPIVSLLRELQIFRGVLTDMVHEVVGTDTHAEEVQRINDLIIETVDLSINTSILQYTAAAEEERESAQGEARELHEQRDRFLATLSHELRNQVSPILLGAQLLKDLKLTDQRVAAAVDRIERQARHQAILIDDLLDISRFRYGKLQLNREDLDLRRPVQHALETLQSDFVAKHLTLTVNLPGKPLFAFADETRIAQILINLLTNALKYTPANGTVMVDLRKEVDSALLSVRDTGIGVEPEALPQLFTMFFQTTEPPTGVKSGLGVGLAVAKVLVELHAGTIEARSEGPGKGAEFIVRLPTSAAIPEATELPPRKVLVVDDNPDHRELLAELLRMRGYEVIEAHDASAALSVILDQKPQACVIDIGLPGMNGYELAKKLRELPETKDSRLIAVTGYGTKADEHSFEDAGFDYYFPKPTNIDALTAALSKR
jgi:signal transduction histidine kinase/CheY-like chemotaxis protein